MEGHAIGEFTPNDLKLSDRGARRGTCMVGGKAAAEAAAVTPGAVRGSAWSGVPLELLTASGNNSVILAMMTNPEPNDVRTILDCGCAIVNADANRPHPADLLEVEGRMPWVGLE